MFERKGGCLPNHHYSGVMLVFGGEYPLTHSTHLTKGVRLNTELARLQAMNPT